jgi:hypothetical protein
MQLTTKVSRRTFLGTAATGVAALGVPAISAAAPGKKLVMLAGKPSHGPMEHEFHAGTLLLAQCLRNVPGLEVVHVKNGWPDSDTAFEGADAVFCYADGGAGHPFIQQNHLSIIGDYMRRGVGLMCAHFGVEVPKDKGGKEFQEWIGGYYEHQYSCNPMWSPAFTDFPEHAITHGVKPFTIRDEWYFNIRFRPHMKGVTPILAAKPSDAVRDGPYVYPRGPYAHIQAAKGRSETMMWATERADMGRGVGFTGGHFHKNWRDDNFRKVVLNALLWICKLDVPPNGVESTVSAGELEENLEPKGARKK